MYILRRIDQYFGRFISVSEEGWTEKTDQSQNKDTMDESEWLKYRKDETLSNKTALFSWIKLLANKEARKFYIFEAVYKIIKKNNFQQILEIGSGQCHISTLLHCSGVKITPTEIGAQNLLIEKIQDLSLPTKEMRLENINEDVLKDVDCILAVQVDYIFKEEELKKLFIMASKTKTNILLVNTQVIGPLQWIKYKILKKSRTNNNAHKKHGYVRSIAKYVSFAKEAGFNLEVKRALITHPSYYFITLTLRD